MEFSSQIFHSCIVFCHCTNCMKHFFLRIFWCKCVWHSCSFPEPPVSPEDLENKWLFAVWETEIWVYRPWDWKKTCLCSLRPSAAEFLMNRSAVWGRDEQTDITVLVCICSTCDRSLCGSHMLMVPVCVWVCVWECIPISQCCCADPSHNSAFVSAWMTACVGLCVCVCSHCHLIFSKYTSRSVFSNHTSTLAGCMHRHCSARPCAVVLCCMF